MPYELFLALRYLRSRRKRKLARVTTLIAVAGIAIGVAALIVALALANGFRDEMRDKILRGTAHITVTRSDGHPMTEYRELAARLGKVAGVISASGTTYDGAVVIGPKGTAYAILRGLDDSSPAVAMDIAESIVGGSADSLFQHDQTQRLPDVLVGAELAARAGATVGDTLEIVTASSSNFGTKRRVRVAGTFRTGLFEYDSAWIYLPLDTASNFVGDAHAASVISVQVNDIFKVKETAERINEVIGPAYTTIDWQEANRPLFTALTLERRVALLIIALIILIASLNIATTSILVVMERRFDIAIINAIGATGRSIKAVFVIEGAITGIIGALSGVVLGALTAAVVNHFKLISLPADVYSITGVYLKLNLRDILIAALVAIALSIIATLYPAGAAARIRPAELLRDAG